MDWTQEIGSKKLFLFDLDGTIYQGDRLYDFSRELVETLRARGKHCAFLTNNSSRSPEDYARKLSRLGIPAEKEQVITSGLAMTLYLKRYHRSQQLYVCGTRSFLRSLEAEGLIITQDPDQAQCLVVGLDTELTYGKLRDMCRILCENPEIPYLATHPDLICPVEFGFVPDCGSICRMIFESTGKMPEFVGKPNPLMPELAMERFGCSPGETLVVGDRLSTDIEAGINAGADTALVLTGEAGVQGSQQSQAKPTYILKNAGEILKAFP